MNLISKVGLVNDFDEEGGITTLGLNYEVCFGSLSKGKVISIKIITKSNISFGLPGRDTLNSVFVSIAIAAGASCLIVDVAKVRSAALAADLILGHDRYAMRYINAYRLISSDKKAEGKVKK